MREGMVSAQTLDDRCLQYKPSRLTMAESENRTAASGTVSGCGQIQT